ncbi:MAG: DNA recombination protein RmuC, partial [Thiovulaceae bacterium]|nr:DNA recombination protein RmuC [Sulfurimonadaceae bacterium]
MELLFAAVGLSLGIVSTMIAGRFIFMRLEKQKQTLENLLIEKETLLTNCKANIQEQEIALVRSLEKQNQLQRIEDQHRKISEEYQDLQVIYEKLKTEYQHFRQTKEELSEDFKQLTSELYEKRTKEFQQSNTQHLEQFLKPFKEQIKSFEEKVHGESKERAVLNQELKNLQNLNLQMRQDAINLTNALKGGNKTQGNWGEVVLERILEESGLSKGREYEIQASLKDETGKRYQPDVIVHLPDKKDI